MSTLRPCLYVKEVWDKKRGTVDTVPPDQALAMSVHNKKTTRYAGGDNTLYTQKHLSATMKLFKPIATLTERYFCYGNQGS